MSQVLHHLDTIYFGTNGMLLFKYPLMIRKVQDLRDVIRTEIEESENPTQLEDDELEVLVNSRLIENGVTDDTENVICDDYTEDEIEADMRAIDWDQAYGEIERIENEKRAKQEEIL